MKKLYEIVIIAGLSCIGLGKRVRRSRVAQRRTKSHPASGKDFTNSRRRKRKHLSAEDIYKALLEAEEDVGLATVYRVLTQFEGVGLVIRHNFDGGHSVFELSRGEHHDHMVCMDTGEVLEFIDEVIEKRQHDIAEKHGFEIVDHSLVIYVRPKKKD